MAAQFTPPEQAFLILFIPALLAALFWLLVSGNSLLVFGRIDEDARKRHLRQTLAMLAFTFVMIGAGFLIGDFKAAHRWH